MAKILDTVEGKDFFFMEREKARIAEYWEVLLERTEDQKFWKPGSARTPTGKCVQESKRLLLDAEILSNQPKHSPRDHMVLYQLYSTSIATAPSHSGDLEAAYFKRANLFFHLKKYSESLHDINRALASKTCPDGLKCNLFVGKTECLAKLSDPSIFDFVEDAKKQMKNLKLLEEAKEVFYQKIENIKNLAVGNLSNFKKPSHKEDQIKLINDSMNRLNVNYQEKIPCASKSIHLGFDEHFERGIWTTQSVNPAEILSIEKFSDIHTYLLLPALYSHCAHCTKFTWSLIPCDNCSLAMYCSDECKSAAYEEYHDIECCIIDKVMKSPELKDFRSKLLFATKIAIKAVKEHDGMIKSLDKCVNVIDYQRIVQNSAERGYTDGVLRGDKCKSVLSLVTNSDFLSDKYKKDISGLSAVVVFYLAKFSSLFEKSQNHNQIPDIEDVKLIGALISRMYHIIGSNSFYFIEEQDVKSRWPWLIHDPSESNHASCYYGFILSPLCSLINHSCTPNAAYCLSDDGELILYSVRKIKKNSQIYICYGDLSWQKNKFERQKNLLSRFHFNCKCDACLYDWPLYETAPLIYLQLNAASQRGLKFLVQWIYKQFDKPTVDEDYLLNQVAMCLKEMAKKKNKFTIPSREFYKLMDAVMHINVSKFRKWVQLPAACCDEDNIRNI